MIGLLSNLIKSISSESEHQKKWNAIFGNDELKAILEWPKEKAQLVCKQSPSCSLSFLRKRDLDFNAKKKYTLILKSLANYLMIGELAWPQIWLIL